MVLLNKTGIFFNQNVPKFDQKIIQSFNGLVDKDGKRISMIVNYICLCGTIAFFGVVANVINVLNFVKQGFDNTINISLFGIAVSDICTLVTVLWLTVCVNPLLQTDDMAFEEIEYLTAGWPHCVFARITCMITVFVTVERCLCVTIPLKVKNIITKTTTKAIVVFIFVSQMLTAIPTYYSAYICWRYIPKRNRTVFGLCRIDNWEGVEFLTFVLQATMQGGSFVLLVFFTVLLIVKIRRKTKWRKRVTSVNQQETLSQRDTKLVRMIILIAMILIVCFIPGAIGFVSMSVEPEYNVGGKYENIFWVSWSVIFVFQTANSSVNILVYYSMSTKYRVIFNEMFAVCRKRLGPIAEKSLDDH